MFQKLRTLTQTNGTVKHLDADYEQLNIRGAVSLQQEVHLIKVSTHGHSSFYYPVTAQIFNSSGKLMVEEKLQSEQFDAIGIVKAAEIIAHHFHLKLSGESGIDRLRAENVVIEKDRITLLPLFKKILRCHTISGKHLQLSNTNAEFVEGEVVHVGENSVIGTLYYTDDYSIASSSKVHHIIRREKE